MLGVVRGVPGDRAPISIRIVIWRSFALFGLRIEELVQGSVKHKPLSWV